VPSDVDSRVQETLVVVSVSRDMMISLAENAEMIMTRTDGRMTRFCRADVEQFKQHSPTRLFDLATRQALVLRQGGAHNTHTQHHTMACYSRHDDWQMC
jgi:hypothetical protein